MKCAATCQSSGRRSGKRAERATPSRASTSIAAAVRLPPCAPTPSDAESAHAACAAACMCCSKIGTSLQTSIVITPLRGPTLRTCNSDVTRLRVSQHIGTPDRWTPDGQLARQEPPKDTGYRAQTLQHRGRTAGRGRAGSCRRARACPPGWQPREAMTPAAAGCRRPPAPRARSRPRAQQTPPPPGSDNDWDPIGSAERDGRAARRVGSARAHAERGENFAWHYELTRTWWTNSESEMHLPGIQSTLLQACFTARLGTTHE